MGSVFGGQAFFIVVIGGERSRVKGERMDDGGGSGFEGVLE